MPKYDTYRRDYFTNQVINEMKENIVYSKTYPSRFKPVFRKIIPTHSDVVHYTKNLYLINDQILKIKKLQFDKNFYGKSFALEKYLSKYFKSEYFYIYCVTKNILQYNVDEEYDNLINFWDNEYRNIPRGTRRKNKKVKNNINRGNTKISRKLCIII
jgi:hypothetical protein